MRQLQEVDYSRPYLMKPSNTDRVDIQKNVININWKHYDKVIKAKWDRGILNYPTSNPVLESSRSIPHYQIKAGDCVEIGSGQRSIVFEEHGHLWIMKGTRRECLTPVKAKLGFEWLYRKTIYVYKVIFTSRQVKEMKYKLGLY